MVKPLHSDLVPARWMRRRSAPIQLTLMHGPKEIGLDY